MKSDYSEKELEMIKILSPSLAERIEKDIDGEFILPIKILEIIALDCFMTNRQGKAVESLRKCLYAYNYKNIYRKTPQYDALIDL